MFQRSQKEKAEFALGAVHRGEILFLQQAGEERLRQILGLRCRVAPASNEDVEGIPVTAAQLFQRFLGQRRGRLTRQQHDAPMRGGKLPSASSGSLLQRGLHNTLSCHQQKRLSQEHVLSSRKMKALNSPVRPSLP